MCIRDRRSKCAPAGVRDELTVVGEVRLQLAEQRLMHQQLKLDALPDWQPVELTQYWGYVLATARARDQTRCSILNALQALEQLRRCDLGYLSSVLMITNTQGGHLPGKPGNVREFQSGQGKVRENGKSQGN